MLKEREIKDKNIVPKTFLNVISIGKDIKNLETVKATTAISFQFLLRHAALSVQLSQ